MKKIRNEIQPKKPQFIELLSEEDKKLYEEMQTAFSSQEYRYNRNRRISISKEVFDTVRNYCERKEEDQWKRYLVCGICWYDKQIGINTNQFGCLISKSKSTINDVISKMGYTAISIKGEPASMLLEKVPYLFGNQNEFRKWTIRQKKTKQNETKNKKNLINKNIENINNTTDDEEKIDGNENKIFFDEIGTETNNDIDIESFYENVDDDFDFEFGYYQDIFSFNSCSKSNNEFDAFTSIFLNSHEKSTAAL